MIELAFIACLVLDPGSCRRESLLFPGTGLMLCMLHGQSQIAVWSSAHPGWMIRKWSCGYRDRDRIKV